VEEGQAEKLSVALPGRDCEFVRVESHSVNVAVVLEVALAQEEGQKLLEKLGLTLELAHFVGAADPLREEVLQRELVGETERLTVEEKVRVGVWQRVGLNVRVGVREVEGERVRERLVV